MAALSDSGVRELLEQPNYAVVSTQDTTGSIHSTIIWISQEDDATVAINSVIGRRWPTNLERNPQVTLIVYEANNPYNFVEIRGQAQGTTDDAEAHIDRLAKKYIGQDEYPYRQPGERRIKFVVTPEHVRHVQQ